MIGLMQRHQLNDQDQIIDTIYRQKLSNAQWTDGTENLLGEGKYCYFAHDEYSQANGENVFYFW